MLIFYQGFCEVTQIGGAYGAYGVRRFGAALVVLSATQTLIKTESAVEISH